MAPQGFSSGSHAILDGLESHTARELKQAAGFESGHTVFPVLIHNGGLNSFLCDTGVRALESHGYLSRVGQPPSFVLPRPWPKLVATGLQHSVHSLKKKKKKKLEKTILRMFKVMQKVANCSCDYVKHGRFSRQSVFQNLAKC